MANRAHFDTVSTNHDCNNTAFPFARSLDIVRDEDIKPRDDPANHGADSVLLGGSERPLRAEGIDLDGLDLEGRWSGRCQRRRGSGEVM